MWWELVLSAAPSPAPTSGNGVLQWAPLIAAAAAIIAATISATVSLAVAVASIIFNALSLRQKSEHDVRTYKQKAENDARTQWWSRVQWALDALNDASLTRRNIGVAALRHLLTDPQATPGDRALIKDALQAFLRPDLPPNSAQQPLDEGAQSDDDAAAASLGGGQS